MKHRQVVGSESSGCVTMSALALFVAYKSIFSSSPSRLTKATTVGMNVGNQAIRALFTGLYAFELLDHDLLLTASLGILCFDFLCGLHLSVIALWMLLLAAVSVLGTYN